MIFKSITKRVPLYQAALFSQYKRYISGLILFIFLFILPVFSIPKKILKWSGQSYAELVNKFTVNTDMTTLDMDFAGADVVEIIDNHLLIMEKFIRKNLENRPDELTAFNFSCKEWKKYIKAECELEYTHWADGTIRNTMYLAMKFDLILNRIIALKNRYAHDFVKNTRVDSICGKWMNIDKTHHIINLTKKDFTIDKGWFRLKNKKKKKSFRPLSDNLVFITWHRDVFGKVKTLLIALADGGGFKSAFERIE